MSASATRPRAAVTDALKNSVPARATATKPSPTLPAADNSIRCASPVRLAPDAPEIRCSVRAAPPAAADPAFAAAEPALAADCEADATDCAARLADWAACLARPPIRAFPMDQVLGLATSWPYRHADGRAAKAWQRPLGKMA